MMHPKTEARYVNPAMGYGAFATADIPRGTVVYVRDALDLAFAGRAANRIVPSNAWGKPMAADENGVRFLGRDNARYVNHRCDCNTMATAYGFAVAVRDIWKGQEISEEYGLYDLGREIPLACGCTRCRGRLRPDDLDRYGDLWDEAIREALSKGADVPQPLLPHMDPVTRQRLRAFLSGTQPYVSVRSLRRDRPMDASSVLPGNPKPVAGLHG
ncbi:MAG: SET domain-containing protein [Pseudodesulfovibrio sp.]|jgi:hypothetical protein|uniref:SET domain-containing protein-lysine N-methyltransferase n=1 Tax=Pseudodesulfovibrio indicus TaxID=1716143 RepID=A0A126QR87_9BACT|nr:SET domain-containing protein [Pseudodesulfovibrio indicus]AMK12570.1 SET domain-containing protein-lysine N-methyltransferase [Pseudodesulfovibrio indicus]TDT90880.1 hypothetical protein EDC59_102313 [Pseudodesulfovibrio indicus]